MFCRSNIETSLYYNRARYYDAQAGRFLSEDPLRFKSTHNFYPYVTNSPVGSTDPSGIYELIWFSPPEAAQMQVAIANLTAKLQSAPCCIDPNLRDKLLNLLQPSSTKSGVSFIYFNVMSGLKNGACQRL
jgi:RHS repeat-associated protein